ncbi:Hypothetical predicted protein [Olea europaea subsp. europaea]|uniref:Uncharacterized protein n=1 Tax=Olea europaea subsp. europaea TaxID=158383 RepID=A0A8S0VKQ4_OLEEU|nr:Hypothetical predicted protein [Olea europaea subsp. europaea]
MPILTESRPSGENMGEVMEQVCPGARLRTGSAKMDITTIQDLKLRVVLFTITRVVGSQAPHEAKRLPIFQGQGAMVADPVPREPRMAHWAALMPRGGGSQ